MYYLIVLSIEIYKIIRKNNKWDYCYNNTIIYSYSDFILKELNSLKVVDVYMFIIILMLLYPILIIQCLFFIFFIITNIKISKGGRLFNIFIYIPYLSSSIIRTNKLKKIINKKTIRIFFINLTHIYIWGFPRIVFNNSYKTLKILKSFKDTNSITIDNINEILSYVYEDVYESLINKIEKNHINTKIP